MSAAWAIEDNTGQLLPGLIAQSRIALGRKVLPGRYDLFRLEVSASYREMFERDLRKVLSANGWHIVRAKARRIASAPRGDVVELAKAA